MKFIIVLCLTGLSLFSYAQNIQGIVKDQKSNPLEYASVLLLMPQDSSMIAFELTDKNGQFRFDQVEKGNYLLQITFLGFETKWMSFQLKDEKLTLPDIIMENSSLLLSTIEVTESMIPMSISKDTVNYNANAFKVRPGDVVEDLLKKLPGIEVERDGSVKAFGENVENVLVDGKEFFGKDTRLATKNLDADAVDKVQVFDRKSDMAEFTGIADGKDERTINLQLKEDKKVGYFGTLESGGGTDDRFKLRGNINRFTPGNRLSVIANGNNINEQGFSMNDYIDFMGGIGSFMSGGGGRVNINLGNDSGIPINSGQTSGIQKSFSGGMNFNKYFSAKTELTSSLFYSDFDNTLQSQTTREIFLNDNSLFRTISQDQQLSGSNNTAFNVRIKSKLDSFQNLIFRLNGNFASNKINTNLSNNTSDDLFRELNAANRQYNLQGNNFRMQTALTYQKKFRKPGRSMVLSGNARTGNTENEGFLQSLSHIYFPQIENVLINQQQLNNDKGIDYQVQGSFIEHLGKKRFLEFNTNFANFHNNALNDYFDFVNNFYIRNEFLSAIFQRDYHLFSNGLKLSVNRKDYEYAIGLNYQQSTLKGRINNESDGLKNNFNAWLPSAFLRYHPGVGKNLNFDYNSRLQEPTLQQLQPVINNSDPLNIYIGNPNLQAEYIHDFDVSYMNYDAFSFTMLYGSLRYSYMHDRITTQINVDSNFVRKTTPVNVKYENNLRGRLEYSAPIRPLKVSVKLNLRSDFNKGFVYVNNSESNVQRFGKGFNFSVENRIKSVLDAVVGYRFYQNNTDYSTNKNLNQWFQESTLFAQCHVTLSDYWNFESNFDYMLYNQSFESSTFVVPLWTAGVTLFFGEQRRLRMSLKAFDLLNKNQGINRLSNLNYTEVSETNVLGRYVLLSIAYNIKGFKKKGGGIEIKM